MGAVAILLPHVRAALRRTESPGCRKGNAEALMFSKMPIKSTFRYPLHESPNRREASRSPFQAGTPDRMKNIPMPAAVKTMGRCHHRAFETRRDEAVEEDQRDEDKDEGHGDATVRARACADMARTSASITCRGDCRRATAGDGGHRIRRPPARTARSRGEAAAIGARPAQAHEPRAVRKPTLASGRCSRAVGFKAAVPQRVRRTRTQRACRSRRSRLAARSVSCWPGRRCVERWPAL